MSKSVLLIGSLDHPLSKQIDSTFVESTDANLNMKELISNLLSSQVQYSGIIVGGSMALTEYNQDSVFDCKTNSVIRSLNVAGWVMQNLSNTVNRILYMPRDTSLSKDYKMLFPNIPDNFGILTQGIWIDGLHSEGKYYDHDNRILTNSGIGRREEDGILNVDDILAWEEERSFLIKHYRVNLPKTIANFVDSAGK